MDHVPIATFRLENISEEFEISSSGHYSVCILGAGSIREIRQVSVHLSYRDGETIDVHTKRFAPRFRKNGKIGIEYWGFRVSKVGKYRIMISNIEYLEAKESMLLVRRYFQKPVDHLKLKIIVCEQKCL